MRAYLIIISVVINVQQVIMCICVISNGLALELLFRLYFEALL